MKESKIGFCPQPLLKREIHSDLSSVWDAIVIPTRKNTKRSLKITEEISFNTP